MQAYCCVSARLWHYVNNCMRHFILSLHWTARGLREDYVTNDWFVFHFQILDFTDHVWTECFSQSLGRYGSFAKLLFSISLRSIQQSSGLAERWVKCFVTSIIYRWMHLDPCEGIYDRPLLYEKGYFECHGLVIFYK